MKSISIYLAGNIQKGHEKESQIYWTSDDQEFLVGNLKDIDVSLLNPAIREDDLSDQHAVFGRDMMQVFCSDLVFVDARERRGLGVGAEMMWAKMNSIPVLTLASKDSHYCKSEVELLGKKVEGWIHPFVFSLSDCIVEDLHQAVAWIESFCIGDMRAIKGPEDICDAMKYYREKSFSKDSPMVSLAAMNGVLKNRIDDVGKEGNIHCHTVSIGK